MKGQIFKSETDLCGAFKDFAERQEWIVYPETSGWDMLLVSDDGKQVGIQAKLAANTEVIGQAIEGMKRPNQPAGCAILVPHARPRALLICESLRIGCMAPNLKRSDLADGYVDFQELAPIKLLVGHDQQGDCRLPPFVPQVPAGVPSPKVLSEWKVRELRLCAIYRQQGFIRPKDLRRCGLDLRNWRGCWLYRVGPSRYMPVEGKRLPDEDHPAAAKQVAIEMGVGAA